MNPQVLIVGGGPCGLATALLLGKCGIRTVLMEKHPGISRHPKAMGVTRRTAEIYRQLGLLEKMQSGGLKSPCDAVATWSRNGLVGELLGSAPLEADDLQFSPCARFHCPQPHTEEVLFEAAKAEPTVEIRYGTRVTDFSQDENSVSVGFENTDGSTGTLSADFLVAADGDRSPTREKLGIPRVGPGELGKFVSVFFRAPYGERLTGRRALIANTIGSDFFEVFVTVNGDDLWLMHHFLDEGEKAEDYDAERSRVLVVKASGLPDVKVEILGLSPWVLSPSLATQWRQGRIFLTGDAAARVSPSGGLGLNNGLQSVHNLAWKLAAVLKGSASRDLLDTYEAERLPAAKFTFENSSGNAEEIFSIVGAAFSGDWETARTLIAASRRAGAGLGQDFGILYESTAITPDGTEALRPTDPVNDYIPQGRPGGRAPHAWIDVDGQRLSTLDLLGREFVGLCGPDADTAKIASLALGPRVFKEDVDFTDPAGTWREIYGLSPKGGVLIRPDGYIAARLA